MKILAIETSCDETAISILEIRSVRHRMSNTSNIRILSNVVASQVKLHAKWGGVVPNLAKREHQRNLPIILKKTLKEAKMLKISRRFGRDSDFTSELNSILEREPELLKKLIPFLKKYEAPKIDLIAVTKGPGLEPCLWQGINFARALAKFWEKPIIGINHMEGHLFSVFLKKNRKENFQFSIFNFQFPSLALLVSGGHTELVLIKNWLKYKVIGQTLDDAAGEAFDKVARLLGLGYPGGPAIANCAARARTVLAQIKLPRPMINSKDYNFSFSGLKTAVLYLLRDLELNKNKMMLNSSYRRNLTSFICKEFQQATIDVLVKKTMAAAKQYKVKTIILGGGVAANKELRHQLLQECTNKCDSRYLYNLLVPEMEFTGDNAAMIALAAYFRRQKTPQKRAGQAIKADGNLKLK